MEHKTVLKLKVVAEEPQEPQEEPNETQESQEPQEPHESQEKVTLIKKFVPRLIIVPEINQSWTIERIARECPPLGWEEVFQDAVPELRDISEILETDERNHGSFYPLKKDIFRAFIETSLNSVNVLICGMDPYPQLCTATGNPRAQGLSFSVSRDDSIPSSLQNIFKELVNTVPGFVMPWHGDLTEWARQGVLLLNAGLTVRPQAPGSHGDIWLGFVSKVLATLAEKRPNTIYVLWGAQAQKMTRHLADNAIVLTAAHPSGLSAHKGFFGCNHFNKINKILIDQGKAPIQWQLSN